MRFHLSLVLFLVLSVISISKSVSALDVGFDGYFRSRANLYNNLDLDRKKSPATRAYTDFRFRLNPSFFVSDKIRIRTSFNIVDGVLGDNPFRSRSYNNPALAQNLLVDPNGVEATVGNPIVSLQNSGYGGVYATDGEVQSADLLALQMRRAWAEFDLPYGTLKVGRMPNQFGMGIYSNAGDGPDQEVGSSRDRIVFETGFGNYYVRPGVGWISEGKIDQASDDFYEYFFTFGRKQEDQEIGMSLAYNAQDAYQPSSSVTNTASLVNAETAYWSFDFYVQNQFSFANLKAEAVLFSGKIVGRDLLAVNGVLRSEFNRMGKFSLLTEAGYSSGTSDTDLARNKIKSFAFSRDYDISLLVFEEVLPGGKSVRNADGTDSNVAASPHAGAISNTVYGRMKMAYDAADFFKPAVNVVVPFAATKSQQAGGYLYGVEYNIITLWPINRYCTADLSFGHFIPGPFYDKVSNSQSAYVLRAGIVTHF
ncbi:MAG: hypothetical protein J0L93_08865 [Deltaproteobacteria bacterium]|nr:hypothetical protein [Deltaproteobacteria bacterium]